MPENHSAAAKPGRPESAGAAQAPTPPHQQDIGKIRAHYIWLTVLTATLTCALICALTAYFCERLHQEGRVRVAALAATIAGGIQADEILTLGSREDEQSPEYRKLCSRLIAARQVNSDVRRIFALTPGLNSKIWHFALDAVTDPSEQIRRGDPFDAGARPQVRHAISGPTADLAPFEDRRGSWLGGYAPIRNREGATVAVLVVEVGAQAALLSERRFRIEATVVYLLLLGGIAFTGFDR